MMTYREYLQQHRYSNSTITTHELRIERFTRWIKAYGTTIIKANYEILLQYAKYLQQNKKYKRSSTNNELRAIKLYYDYLIVKEIIVKNPAENLIIRGKYTKVLNNLLKEEELEDLYYSFEIKHHDTFFRATKQRDKVITGLIVYQGITAVELYNLKEEHLELTKGKIYIPSTRRSNRRTLKLQPSQIIGFIEYTTKARIYLSKRNNATNEEQLFYASLHLIHRITGRIIKTLKTHNHKVKSYAQIRSSVIVNWLEKNNLRHVQYMAGHRYISSTEKYVQDNLENLHEIVNTLHPLS